MFYLFNFLHLPFSTCLTLFFVSVVISPINSQSYYACGSLNSFWRMDNIPADCNCSNCNCNIEYIGPTGAYWKGVAMSPDNKFFVFNGNSLYEVDVSSGFLTPYFDLPAGSPSMAGIVSIGNGMFYSITAYGITNTNDLYLINVPAGTISNLGSVPIINENDITGLNGEYYFETIINTTDWGIVKLDINNPNNSSLVTSFPASLLIEGITASDICNTIIGTSQSLDQLV